MTTPGTFYSGTSGLVLPVPNKQAFPEAFRSKTRLTFYASLFNSIEINSSFYKVPQAKTFAKWTDETPESFRFTVKLWQGITHEPGLSFNNFDVDRFMQAAQGIGGKKGCLLVQLPPGAGIHVTTQLERLLTRLAPYEWRLAVEFRHPSWYVPETSHLLQRYGASLVLHDIPKSKMQQPGGTTDFIYVRYHGPAGDYKGGYSEEQLTNDSLRMKTWLSDGKDLYVYFNNTIGDALVDLQRLQKKMNANAR